MGSEQRKSSLNRELGGPPTPPKRHSGIPIDFRAILSSLVHFQGRVRKFQDILEGIDVQDITDIMDGCLYEKDYLDFFNTGEKMFTLVRENLPPPPPVYIPRWISNRVKLSPAIFKENCLDVFVFKCMERSQLAEVAESNNISTSTSQRSKLTSRFILLEDDTDWEIIRSLATAPVHLIRYEEAPSAFILVETSWSSESTSASSSSSSSPSSQSRSPEKQKVYISEEEFITKIHANDALSGACICDTPGTGKSLVLASLARKTWQMFPERVVAFISLPHFIKNLGKPLKLTDLNPCNALLLILEHISPSPLAKAILLKALAKNAISLDLFIDGFEEICPENVKWTKEVLRIIALNKVTIKIFITAGPQHRSELEVILGVVAYDIVPFTDANQVSFLVSIWKQHLPSNREESKLVDLATQCLPQIKNISKESRAILGVPLHSNVIAGVNLKIARMYSQGQSSGTPQNTPSIFHLYKNYMEERFSCDDRPIIDQDPENSDNQKIKVYHVWHALKLLFPEIAPAYFRHEAVQENVPSKHSLFRLLEEQCSGDSVFVTFVHHTFAEFLAAEFFADILTNHSILVWRSGLLNLTENSVMFLPFAVKTIGTHKYGWVKNFSRFDTLSLPSHVWLYEFRHPVIAYFLNAHLSTLPITQFTDQFLVDQFSKLVNEDWLYKILYCCISQNYNPYLHFLKIILEKVNAKSGQEYKSYLQHKSIHLELEQLIKKEEYLERSSFLMCLATEYCPLTTCHQFSQLLSHCFQYTIHDIYANLPLQMVTPLHLAIDKTDYSLVEYFVDKISLKGRQLLYHCVRNSYGEPPESIRKRMDICKLFLSKNKGLVNEPGFTVTADGRRYKCPLILVKSVDLELLKFLVNNGADLHASGEDTEDATIVTVAAEYMLQVDFQELVGYLIHDCRAVDLFIPNYIKYQYPLHRVLKSGQQLTLETLKMILDNTGIPVNEKDGHGKTLLFYAVRGNQSISILEELVRRGAHYKKKDKLNERVLQYATENGGMEMMRYLKSFGLSVNVRDKDGNTPLHLASQNQNVIKSLISANANVDSVNQNGETFCHLAAISMPQEDFHELVCYLLKQCKAVDIFKTKNKRGRTPLHERMGSTEIQDDSSYTLELILGIVGFKVNGTDKLGNSLVMLAVQGRKSVEIIKTLIGHGVDFTKCNKRGESVLHVAVECGYVEAVRYFVSLGMKVGQRDGKGESALGRATKEFKNFGGKMQEEMVTLLKE